MIGSKLSRFYTAIIVLLPVLNIYGSFIPSVEIGTLMICLLSIVFILRGKTGPVGRDRIWSFVLLTFFICTFFSAFYNEDYSFRYFARLLKITVIVLSLVWAGKKIFDYEYAQEVLIKFSLVSAIFMIVQYVLFGLGIRIKGVITSLAAVQAEDTGVYVAEEMFRPSSFFIEPSNYASYQLIFLAYLLTHPTLEKRNKYLILVLLGIFLSTSGTGYISSLIIIVASFLLKKGMSLKKRHILALVMAVGAFLASLLNTSIGQQSIRRFLNDDGTWGSAATGRLDSGAAFLFGQLPEPLQWIGCGFGYRPEDIYFPSVYSILYGDGYIGLAVFVVLLLYYFRSSSSFAKLLCLSYTILCIGTGVFNFASVGVYFAFIIYDYHHTNQEKLSNDMLG